jgi:ribosomal protein S18 acetylase RimI-like enzyme
MPDIRLLGQGEWPTLRNIRLSALQEAPHAFLSTYEQEQAYSENQWRAEFVRGDWSVGNIGGRPISLLGATREPDTTIHEYYLEYLWVSPECRRSGVASGMLTAVLDRLRTSGVQTAFLWVLEGNDAAMRLFRQVGFVSSNYRQPLAAHPGRSEERMQLNMS